MGVENKLHTNRNMSDLPPTFVNGFHDEASVRKMTYRRLGETDMVVSTLSLGTSSFSGMYRDEAEDDLSVKIVHEALSKGMNLIDSAPWYGQGRAEEVLGRALTDIPRKSYYVATKVGRYETNVGEMFDFSVEKVLKSVDDSLDKLGLDYIDLLQVHDIEFCVSLEQIVNFVLPALHKLREQGKVRYIGITGYNVGTLRKVVELTMGTSMKVDTVLNYCRANILDQTLLGPDLTFFSSHGVGLINASPICMGLLAENLVPHWHPASPSVKHACVAAHELCKSKGENLSEVAVLWVLARQQLATTLVSTPSMELMQLNLTLAQKAGELTCNQEDAVKEVEKVFKFLPCTHWENKEVDNYWKEMEK